MTGEEHRFDRKARIVSARCVARYSLAAREHDQRVGGRVEQKNHKSFGIAAFVDLGVLGNSSAVTTLHPFLRARHSLELMTRLVLPYPLECRRALVGCLSARQHSRACSSSTLDAGFLFESISVVFLDLSKKFNEVY